MKKIFLAVLLSMITVTALSANNPPVFGDSVYELSSPKTLTGGASVAGGAIFAGGPDSIISNPAIIAREQRVALNVGYTALFSNEQLNEKKFGSALQTSILVPFKLCIVSGYLNGTFVPFKEMNLGNSVTFKTAVAKPITDKLDIGIGLNAGFTYGEGKDWLLSGNLGGVYHWGDLGFMKDFRIGVSVLNLGHNFNNTNLIGSNPEKSADFPTIATVKVGAAASLYKNDTFNIAYALDLSTPCFQNLIVDATIQAALKDMLYLSVSEKLNIREMADKHVYMIPAIGLNFKFSFDFSNNDYMSKNGWEQSEFNAYGAYRNINSTVTAASVGVDLMLGMKDTTPPVIELWLDEEDDE